MHKENSEASSLFDRQLNIDKNRERKEKEMDRYWTDFSMSQLEWTVVPQGTIPYHLSGK